MTITNKQARALARMRLGPCLAFDLGLAAAFKTKAQRAAVNTRDAAEVERLCKLGARIGDKLIAAGLARCETVRRMTVYGLTLAGHEAS